MLPTPSSQSPRFGFDVVVVGSGLAGLTIALHLAPTRRVALVSKQALNAGASDWAQGGIAAVLDAHDSVEHHVQDTLVAGAGLCDEAAVRFVVERGRASIEWLIERGVEFTRDAQGPAGLHLTREGGHSARRIAHAADATGHAVQLALEAQARAHPNITLFEYRMAIDLIVDRAAGEGTRCSGIYLLNLQTNEVEAFAASDVVLATGGLGQVYLHTSNPATATGDGIAIAWRAGCRVANLEFVQFHPTCLVHPQASAQLITEAMRGEGAHLVLPPQAGARAGVRFMPEHDERAELAPRDVVARAIDAEIKRHGLEYVHLDISHRPPEFVREHFPTLYARCLALGIDMTREPLPVAPAAHYACGGIHTDLNGRTDIHGLYAIGETACTGLHGANRLASNSLLECVVLGHAAATHILAQAQRPIPHVAAWDASRVKEADEDVALLFGRDELRRAMLHYVGIVRTSERLLRARRRIALLRDEIDAHYRRYQVSRAQLELRNLVEVASLIVESALQRHESRGLHYNRDFPEPMTPTRSTLLGPA
ncbi:MAG TPA: L-aspartate oxidase [Burkholderiaceae bacterium]|nr:L-aspartate oxidase [Burkholderiaceae bacterium]